jgi:hypothetical protein
LGHKRVRYTDFKRDKFNSELEAVEENSVKLTWPFSHIHVLQGIQASCLSDVSLAFAVQDVPSEALAFSLFITRWAEAGFKLR